MSYRNLKMHPADYDRLRCIMLDTTLKDARSERQRWDALNAAVDTNMDTRRFVYNTLYSYLSDAHIDSALRQIVAGSAITC